MDNRDNILYYEYLDAVRNAYTTICKQLHSSQVPVREDKLKYIKDNIQSINNELQMLYKELFNKSVDSYDPITDKFFSSNSNMIVQTSKITAEHYNQLLLQKQTFERSTRLGNIGIIYDDDTFDCDFFINYVEEYVNLFIVTKLIMQEFIKQFVTMDKPVYQYVIDFSLMEVYITYADCQPE